MAGMMPSENTPTFEMEPPVMLSMYPSRPLLDTAAENFSMSTPGRRSYTPTRDTAMRAMRAIILLRSCSGRRVVGVAEAPRERAVMEDVVRAVGEVVCDASGVVEVVLGVSGVLAEPLVVEDEVLGLESGCVAYAGESLPAVIAQ